MKHSAYSGPSAISPRDTVGWLRMERAQLLEAIGLDVEFERAHGDYLYWTAPDGVQRRVLDLVGSFGVNLLGHNHPEVCQAAREYLTGERPLLVQGSKRAPAERLKQRLARLLRAELDEDYTLLLLSTGAEAVEAAIKHARLELTERQAAVRDQIRRQMGLLVRRVTSGEQMLDEAFYRRCEELLGVARIADLQALSKALSAANAPALNDPGFLVSPRGGYHGKTAGALAVTWNPTVRLAFNHDAADVVFYETGKDRLEDIARRRRRTVYRVDPIQGRLVAEPFDTMVAIICEPIQGEGGVIPVQRSFVQDLVAYRSAHPEVPVIVDEIQTGLGRTGTLFESSARGLPVDYITLGKALGGGIGKVSALGIRRDRFQAAFTHLHSSTFAEDELSSAIADRVLEIIERDRVPRRCAMLGRQLGEALQRLAEQFPGQIAEIRGQGLMRAIELADQHANPSPLIRSLADEGLLAIVLAAFLLHEHGVRVLPTLGHMGSLRLAPSAYLEPEAVQHIHDAFADACTVLARGDAFGLLRHLVGSRRPSLPPARRPAPQPRLVRPEQPTCFRVGFLCHFISSEDLASWDPALGAFTLEEREELMERFAGAVRPHLFAREIVHSPQGTCTELLAIGIFMDARAIERDMRENRGRMARNHVLAAYDLARKLGCSMVGFGGYTSIVTANCTEITDHHPAVTTGNSLTVAMGHEAVRQGAADMGLPLAHAHAGVVGVTGNIGHVYARLLAAEVGRLTIVGRPGSMRRLRAVAVEIAEELAQLARRGAQGGALLARCADACARAGVDEDCTGEALLDRLEHALGEPLVELCTDLAQLRAAQVILSVSNSAAPILRPEHIAPDRPVLICDLAVPGDVSPEVHTARPLARVIPGGIVSLPRNSDFRLPGTSTPPGTAYACLAETLLLGLSGVEGDFSRGAITTAQVREIAALAQRHGFGLASVVEESFDEWTQHPVKEAIS